MLKHCFCTLRSLALQTSHLVKLSLSNIHRFLIAYYCLIRLLEHYILNGPDPNAANKVMADLLDPKRKNPQDLDRHVANLIKDVLPRLENPHRQVASEVYKISWGKYSQSSQNFVKLTACIAEREYICVVEPILLSNHVVGSPVVQCILRSSDWDFSLRLRQIPQSIVKLTVVSQYLHYKMSGWPIRTSLYLNQLWSLYEKSFSYF